jgi:pimeloyl-ACP methyl ester carboxylesterase
LPHITIGGENFYYAGSDTISGTAIIFCHGSGGGHHHWVYQLKGLKTDRVSPIAVDLPGHGRSGGSLSDSIAGYRDWLYRFAEALNLKSLIIAGHSMGGAIALDYVLHYPDQISGLVLVGSGCRLRVMPELLNTLREGKVPDKMVDYLFSAKAEQGLIEKGREEVQNTDAAVYYADLSACDRFDVNEELGRINKPVLMICGSEDQLTPVKYSRYLENNLPDGRIQEIAEAGHMVMLERPEEVNLAISTFVEEITAG